MTDLVAFIRARLDEREAWANALMQNAEASDLARQEGLFALRDIEAKRRIIDRCENAFNAGDGGSRFLAADVLLLLVSAYENHPDFPKDWRP